MLKGWRTRPHCRVGYILADVAYSRQRPSGQLDDMRSCSGSHCQGWAPLRFPLHVSKALSGHPEGERQHVSGRILALRDPEALSNRTM